MFRAALTGPPAYLFSGLLTKVIQRLLWITLRSNPSKVIQVIPALKVIQVIRTAGLSTLSLECKHESHRRWTRAMSVVGKVPELSYRYCVRIIHRHHTNHVTRIMNNNSCHLGIRNQFATDFFRCNGKCVEKVRTIVHPQCHSLDQVPGLWHKSSGGRP